MKTLRVFDHVPESISFAIWATAFLQGRETLERAVDSMSDSPRVIETGVDKEHLSIYLSRIRRDNFSGIRCHFPIEGNTDSIIGIDEFVDISLRLGHCLTSISKNPKGIILSENTWIEVDRKKSPAPLKNSWQDFDKSLSDSLHEISEELEAFDLIKHNNEARNLLIDLDHDISIQQFPDDQNSRITFLIGRLLRVLAITQFALEENIQTFSASKNQLISTPILELNQICRSGLSTVVNYGIENLSTH